MLVLKDKMRIKNAVDAAKAAGVKQIIYTSLVNADDETNPSSRKERSYLY